MKIRWKQELIIGFNNTSINKPPLSWEQSSQDHTYKFNEEHFQVSTKNKPSHNMCICSEFNYINDASFYSERIHHSRIPS